MEKIAILTDSASDLTKTIIDKYDIKILPFKIIYSYGEFEDSVTITPDEVYKSFEKEIPTTSLPSMEIIDSIYTKLESEGYTHVISINISSNLSGTLNSVRLVSENHPNIKTFVYDTKTLTAAQGSIVIEACKMIEKDKSFDDIINALPSFRKRVHCFFTVKTLEYLRKGGRIGRVAGTIGELLNLKPIIQVANDGVYTTYSKVRGRKQALSKLETVLREFLDKSKCNVWILHGDAHDECLKIYNSIKSLPNINEAHLGTISPALGVHTGPGLIGFIIQEIE